MNKTRLIFLVLGIFLILSGLVAFISGLSSLGVVIAVLALIAGVLILLFSPGVSLAAGWILAAVYLIALGLQSFFDISFNGMGIVMAVLAIAAGIALLIRAPKIKKHIGFFLFTIWLILTGLTGFVDLGQFNVVIPVIAIASGFLMIINH